MNHLCPVCNGFTALQQACSTCGQALQDAGRLYDFYGDYSPYREIDDSKMDNGYMDRTHHQCIHTGWCPSCQTEQMVFLDEWTPAMLVTNMEKDAYQ
ncbi:hypothetical protein ABE237_27790 [Brevibacillus formosus]|uniref:hypothetical protein n=1 Tax=Brevibacillus formosus TaxID=54913 RepID=UPI0018CD6F8C|nr:hypothetical protein [Brevibacillus formosus]MBG9942874.1 hypothetical protein [Brevibacillus formosus]